MKLKEWHKSTSKEKNDYLGHLGGCGACDNWDSLPKHQEYPDGPELGCRLKYGKDPFKDRNSYQIYDNGCMCHSKL